MALIVFHRVLIAAAILFDGFFTLFCIRKYNRNGDVWELALGFGSSLLTIGLVAYLIHFNRKVKAIRLVMAAQDRLCPQCRYDLQGSLAANATACPECGCEITDQFRREAMKTTGQTI